MNTTLTPEQIAEVQAIIKSDKWDKASYAYAVAALTSNAYLCMMSWYTKKELVEMFNKYLPIKFNSIKSYTCFKNLSF